MSAVENLIERAEKSLNTACYLLELGDYEACVSRSYYAMFYIAEAALFLKGISPSSHKGVINLFGNHFVKPGIFSREFGKMLSVAYSKRLLSDYGVSLSVTREEAERVLESAQKFVAGVKKYLLKWMNDSGQSAQKGN